MSGLQHRVGTCSLVSEAAQEQDRETAGRVGELSAQLKALESHKGMLQRSKWMLLAAAREKADALLRLSLQGLVIRILGLY